jgi:coenzyme Q-binding protein COQ10
MPKASVKRIIHKKKDKLIEFVLDIERYPEFIPFCLGSKVYDRKEENNQVLIIADLTIGKGPFSDTYKSDIRFNKKDDTINVTNIEGPLKYLKNNWKFIENKTMTEVFFDVDFEIKNKFLNLLMERSFEFGLNKIADAFQKRAKTI